MAQGKFTGAKGPAGAPGINGTSGGLSYAPITYVQPATPNTSGTTGKPKGIVHSHCGFPVKAAQDMAFGTDVGPGDRISWVTDIGWMMGPWLIYGAAILGAILDSNSAATRAP